MQMRNPALQKVSNVNQADKQEETFTLGTMIAAIIERLGNSCNYLALLVRAPCVSSSVL